MNLSLKNPNFVPLETIFKAEEEKSVVCKQNSIIKYFSCVYIMLDVTLIRVPRSWDLKPSDLIGAIAQHRKDLVDRLDIDRIQSKAIPKLVEAAETAQAPKETPQYNGTFCLNFIQFIARIYS